MLCRSLRSLVAFGALASVLGVSPAFAGEVRYAGQGHAESPAWSKDGKWLAYEVNNLGGTIEMYLSNVNGAIAKDGKKLTLPGGSSPFGGGASILANATWHPDGVVVFEGSNQGGNLRLYYVETSATAASEMVSTTEIPGDLTFPSIPSSGTVMAFISDASGAGDIRTRTDAGKIGQLTTTSYSEMFPMFSPDGAQVVFSRKKSNTEDLFVLPAAGGDELAVVGGGGDQTRPTWAEGGRIVYFDGGRGPGLWDLSSVSAPGGEVKVLARGVRLPTRSRPGISPDGKWVAYTFDDPTKSNKVMVSRTDGSKTVEIPTSFEACGEPALGVQAGRMLLAYTALPDKGADWRFLYVEDITDKLQ